MVVHSHDVFAVNLEASVSMFVCNVCLYVHDMTTVNTEHDMNMIAALLNMPSREEGAARGGDMHCHLPASRPCTPDNLLNRTEAGINTINHHGVICGKK